MSDQERPRAATEPPRVPTERWRRLPDRIDPADTVESKAEVPGPVVPPAAGDPDTNFMLRYAG
jgi:hypothetical protein